MIQVLLCDKEVEYKALLQGEKASFFHRQVGENTWSYLCDGLFYQSFLMGAHQLPILIKQEIEQRFEAMIKEQTNRTTTIDLRGTGDV